LGERPGLVVHAKVTENNDYHNKNQQNQRQGCPEGPVLIILKYYDYNMPLSIV
jgi:hypothetical protein